MAVAVAVVMVVVIVLVMVELTVVVVAGIDGCSALVQCTYVRWKSYLDLVTASNLLLLFSTLRLVVPIALSMSFLPAIPSCCHTISTNLHELSQGIVPQARAAVVARGACCYVLKKRFSFP